MKSSKNTTLISLDWTELDIKRHYTPEQTLVMAIIHRAVKDYLGDYYEDDNERRACRIKREQKREAKYWLMSPLQHPWSFLWCLSIITDDAEGMQKRIIKELHCGELKEKADEWFAIMEKKRKARLFRAGGVDRQISFLKH